MKRVFSILPPQSMQIGSLNIQQVSFAVPAESGENALTSKEDGLLTTYSSGASSSATRIVLLSLIRGRADRTRVFATEKYPKEKRSDS